MGIIGGIGVPELLIILVVVLLIFGPKNLPKLGASLGKTVKNIRKGMSDEDDNKKIDEVEVVDAEDADVEDEDADVEEEEEAPKKKAAPRKRTTSTTARRAKKADEDADAE
ncbi:MAG: twin-arginine translocase TatA/TatE family subunit [Coriobacteriia bacterium]|nr:twin-arginine translocase TatA/TatE family subunit [Coriobacteriia bacterium]MBS5478742.1 twin-arginine translocase TatA/TatE family subunit [Coriobacteriia bacterium]